MFCFRFLFIYFLLNRGFRSFNLVVFIYFRMQGWQTFIFTWWLSVTLASWVLV